MSFLGNFFDRTGRRSSLKEAQQMAAAVKRTLSDEEEAPQRSSEIGSSSPKIISNIKQKGKVMVFDEKTFSFKLVHEDPQESGDRSVTDSPTHHSISSYRDKKSLQLNEVPFEFKLSRKI